MARPVSGTARLRSFSLAVLTSCALLAVLIYGRGFLIPLVIAVLCTSLISSIVHRLEGIGFPSWLALAAAIGAGVLALFLFFMIAYEQADAMTAAWPRYAARIGKVLEGLMSWAGPEIVERVKSGLAQVDIAGHLQSFADSAGGFLAGLGLVIMYTAFLLAERGGMASKFERLVQDPERSAELHGLFESVVHGIRRYLTIKMLTSLLTGSLCYIILRLYGVDFAEIWGLLVFLLNFIPTIGSIVAVIIPSLFTLAQFDMVWSTVQVAALMATVQFVIGNILEPRFLGRTLNLSPFVVIVSLTFWGTIWGAVGMFLSVPIAASMVIVCRNVPDWRWLAVLMSSDGRPEAADESESLAGGKGRRLHLPWPFGGSTAEQAAADRDEPQEQP